ncbi:hypothetical protein PMAYCL1PPCAC_25379 [Pristionchus mayeri]|uniref:Uncharacterized protein n=1 Tax=Pristionchus mayeri TaxID=1317129 RepID=A0AAN5I8C6_9BILA|nr:hypothetical protein PMAYCL1PPCAC_25379 [Pristionchus mayeri]
MDAGAKDVTCAFAAGKCEFTQPNGSCSKLEERTCDNPANCDYTKIVYTPYKDGWRVTCKEGSLITDKSGPNDPPNAHCAGGVWKTGEPIAKASCVTVDSTVVQECINQIQTGPDSVTVSCKFGSCIFTCSDSRKQFHYTVTKETTVCPLLNEPAKSGTRNQFERFGKRLACLHVIPI